VQGSLLKVDLEGLNIKKTNNSITLTDIANFYPLVSFKIVKKAVWFFTRDLECKDKEKLKIGIELLRRRISIQIA